jgi:hypothetical protein
MTPETLNKWAILPRFMMFTFTVLTWRVVEWFMTIPDPSAAQAGLVSIVTGCASGAFAIWINKEVK